MSIENFDAGDGDDDELPVSLPPEDHEPLTRRQVLGLLERAMGETMRKIERGKIQDESKERVRIRRMDSLVSLAKEHRLAKADLDLDEMRDELDAIEHVEAEFPQ